VSARPPPFRRRSALHWCTGYGVDKDDDFKESDVAGSSAAQALRQPMHNSLMAVACQVQLEEEDQDAAMPAAVAARSSCGPVKLCGSAWRR
jgi:hypothetical protein